MSGRISFIGAGPGAADLITVRGARRIAEADVVLWAASLVAPECIQEHARADAELIDSSRLTHEGAIEIYRRAEREKRKIARVHSGDPSLWGEVQQQHDACARMQLEVEIVPGVAAFSAAAATAGHELTVPEVAQSLVLTRLEGGKTPMPEGEKVREFAKHGTTMALFLSAGRAGQLVEELRAGGYADDVPVLVGYKVSWPDELMLRTTLGELEATVKHHKLWRHTLFVVGRALHESRGTRSRSHDPGRLRGYRRPDPAARKASRAEQGESGQAGAGSRPRRSGGSWLGSVGWDGEPESVPEPRTADRRSGRSDSDMAWWAVRDWQQTARESARFVTRPARRGAGAAQPDLFVGTDPDQDAIPDQDPIAVELGEPESASDVRNLSLVPTGSDVPAGLDGPADLEGPAGLEGPVGSDGVVADEVDAENRSDAAEATVDSASEVDAPVAEPALSAVPDPEDGVQSGDGPASRPHAESRDQELSDQPASLDTSDSQDTPRSQDQLASRGKAVSQGKAAPRGKAAGAKAAGSKSAGSKTAGAKTAGAKTTAPAKRSQGKTAQDKSGDGKPVQERTAQEKPAQDKTAQDKSKQGKTGQAKSARGRSGTARTRAAEAGSSADSSTEDDHSG